MKHFNSGDLTKSLNKITSLLNAYQGPTYQVITQRVDLVMRYYVLNTTTNAMHSKWDTYQGACVVCNDLNRMVA
jgi:hypothetical protein